MSDIGLIRTDSGTDMYIQYRVHYSRSNFVRGKARGRFVCGVMDGWEGAQSQATL